MNISTHKSTSSLRDKLAQKFNSQKNIPEPPKSTENLEKKDNTPQFLKRLIENKPQEPEKAGQPDPSHAHKDLQSKYKPDSQCKYRLTESESQKLKAITPLQKTNAGRKIIRASKKLADYITENDVAESARVIREAKNATMKFYDTEEKRMTEIPDFRTRLAATTLERAYDEGTPVQRQIVLTGKFDTDEAVVSKLAENEEALRAIETLSKMGIRVDYENEEEPGEIIDAETSEVDPDPPDQASTE